jgi:hypothetical protein
MNRREVPAAPILCRTFAAGPAWNSRGAARRGRTPARPLRGGGRVAASARWRPGCGNASAPRCSGWPWMRVPPARTATARRGAAAAPTATWRVRARGRCGRALELAQPAPHRAWRGWRAARTPGTRVIAYFQSYSNTYVERARLEEVLGVVEPHVGRPRSGPRWHSRSPRARTRCPTAALDVLARWNERLPVWVELGLEVRRRPVCLIADPPAAHGGGLRGLRCAATGARGLLDGRPRDPRASPSDGREGARRTAEVLARCGRATASRCTS